MRTEQITCDICGTIKKETNHWWRIGCTHEKTKSEKYGALVFIVVRADAGIQGMDEIIDVCGDACAGRALGHFLHNGTLKVEPPPMRKVAP